MLRSFIRDENAVNIQIAYIINFLVLMIVTIAIAGAFYLRAEDASHQAMLIGFTDLGSGIARDRTNMYLTAENSNNITINVTRSIPLTIGGKGYVIQLNPPAPTNNGNQTASINIGSGVYGYNVTTQLNSIDSNACASPNNCAGIVYSGSGEININMIKINGIWNLSIN